MTRISTFAQNQAVVAQMLRAQSQVADTQRQVSTGEISDSYKGMARNASALVGARAVESRTLKYIDLAKQAISRVDLQATGISTMYSTAAKLRQNLLNALANNSGRTVAVDVNAAFEIGKSVLNTKANGRYIYAGSRTDMMPFGAANLADLATVANPVSGYFANDTKKSQVRVDQNLNIEYGQAASEMGQDLMASIKTIAEYNAATPIGESLTPADRAIIKAQIANLDTVMGTISGIEAANGIVQKRLEDIVIRHEEIDVVNKRLIADVSEVDMAAAIARLNQDQLAVEASYSLIRQLNKISLLNFI